MWHALTIVAVFLCLTFGHLSRAHAAACDSNGTGNWSASGTWTNCGGTTPGASDSVTIKNTHVVTIDGTTAISVSSLTIQDGGTLTQDNKNQQVISGALTIDSGGTLKHSQNTDSASPWASNADVDFKAATMVINGTINVDGLGYTGGSNSDSGDGPGGGLFTDFSGGGGAHGGDGGNSQQSAAGGSGNDLLKTPTDHGSGGGGYNSTNAGGNGGGGVELEVTATGDALTLAGTISAKGNAGTSGGGSAGGGGGAGGAVYVNMSGGGNITGTGTIDVIGGIGGNGANKDGGAGGGGRIALVGYGTVSSLTLSYYGGTGPSGKDGGSGTLVQKATGTDGNLFLDNNGLADYTLSTMASAEGTVTFDNIKVQNSAQYVIPSGERIDLDASTFTAPTTGEGKFRVEGSLYVNNGGDTFTVPENVYLIFKTGATFQSNDGSSTNVDLTTAVDGGDADSTAGIVEMADYTNSSTALAFGAVTLNGRMTHEQNGTGDSMTDKIKISATSFTIASGGIIDVDGFGYRGATAANGTGSGTGPGVGDADGGGGGGHAGSGGVGHDGTNAGGAGGSSYDTAAAPTDHGSGGGAGAAATTSGGGNGGGSVQIAILSGGTFTFSGTITADGANGLASGTAGGGGGSGGAIYINFPSGGTYAGSNGTMTVTGGAGANSTSNDGGGGSGGLIAVIGYTTSTISGLTTTTTGGAAGGATGTTAGANGTYTATAAGALSSTNVAPATLVAGANGQATVTFTTANAIAATGKIVITFGSNFSVASASGGTCSTMDGSFATAVSGQVVTITRSAGGSQSAAAESCAIDNVRNPQVSGSTGTYKIITTDSADQIVDGDLAVSADTITVGALTSTNVEPASLKASTSSTATITFTTANPIPITGKIKIIFGTNFNVASASGGTCSTMDGSFATAVSSQTVTITRSAGTAQAAAAESCTVANITNPAAAGSTGTYTIRTTDGSDTAIDEDTAVAADTIVARRFIQVGQRPRPWHPRDFLFLVAELSSFRFYSGGDLSSPPETPIGQPLYRIACSVWPAGTSPIRPILARY